MSEIVLIHGQRHVAWQCGSCGVWSTCPEIVYDRHRAEGGFHHCPNGHSWGWNAGDSEREKLRRERDRLKQDAARLEEEKRQAWATANAQAERARKAEAATARLKKRTAAGTCPCCQRTFSRMAEHMKRQHPNYVKETGANVVAIPSVPRPRPHKVKEGNQEAMAKVGGP